MTSTDDLVLRPAGPEDAAAVAEVHLTARRAAVPSMPPLVHDDDDVRRWLSDHVTSPGPGEETWVAEDATGRVVGYARFTQEWLDDLYVAPSWQGRGVGSALLGLVMARRPRGFALWVFESNQAARAFYRSCGLFEAERTDGEDNEEKAPDIRMVWAVTQEAE